MEFYRDKVFIKNRGAVKLMVTVQKINILEQRSLNDVDNDA